MRRPPERLLLVLLIGGAFALMNFLTPACAPSSTCLRVSDCADNFTCSNGTCAPVVQVDAGASEASSSDAAAGDGSADSATDGGEDGDEDASEDGATDASDDGAHDAASDAAPRADGGDADAHVADAATDGGDASSHD